MTTWFGHGVAEWQTFSQQQKGRNQPVEVSGLVKECSQSTLENWHKFLQRFSFPVVA